MWLENAAYDHNITDVGRRWGLRTGSRPSIVTRFDCISAAASLWDGYVCKPNLG